MNSDFYLTLQSTYHSTSVALCTTGTIVDVLTLDNKTSSKLLISTIDTLLQLHKKKLSDLSFIATYQGPAPFTSLRTVIATVNGIAYGNHTPLVPLDGLRIFLEEYSHVPHTIALLNAFCNDVYFAFFDKDNNYHSGTYSITDMTRVIQEKFPCVSITFIGNGTLLHKELLLENLGTRAQFPQPIPEIASLVALAQQAYSAWQDNQTTDTIMPLYLKQHSAILGN